MQKQSQKAPDQSEVRLCFVQDSIRKIISDRTKSPGVLVISECIIEVLGKEYEGKHFNVDELGTHNAAKRVLQIRAEQTKEYACSMNGILAGVMFWSRGYQDLRDALEFVRIVEGLDCN